MKKQSVIESITSVQYEMKLNTDHYVDRPLHSTGSSGTIVCRCCTSIRALLDNGLVPLHSSDHGSWRLDEVLRIL